MPSYSPRFLLICLMLVLLPLQGFASTGLWAFLHENAVQTTPAAGVHNNDHGLIHCEAMQQYHQQNQHASAQVSAHDNLGAKPDVQNHCKGASPCCIGIALLLQQPAPWFSPVTATVYPLAFHSFSSAPARALERPPKKSIV